MKGWFESEGFSELSSRKPWNRTAYPDVIVIESGQGTPLYRFSDSKGLYQHDNVYDALFSPYFGSPNGNDDQSVSNTNVIDVNSKIVFRSSDGS